MTTCPYCRGGGAITFGCGTQWTCRCQPKPKTLRGPCCPWCGATEDRQAGHHTCQTCGRRYATVVVVVAAQAQAEREA